MENQSDGLINEQEAARKMGVKPITLQLWRLAGKGPRYVRLGTRTIRYRPEDIAAWIDARTMEEGA